MSQTEHVFHVDESKPWFQPEAGWPANVPKNLDFPRITLYEMLSEAAAENPDKPVLWFLKAVMSYGELLKQTDAFAGGLAESGIGKGDVVALAMPNCFQYAVAYYACAKIGAIVTGVNPLNKPAEVLHQLQCTKPKALVVLDAVYAPLFGTLGEHSTFDLLIGTNLLDLVPMPVEQKAQAKQAGIVPTGPVPESAVSFEHVLAMDAPPVQADVSPDDVATYIMTGGTTGTPKVAVLTHFNCITSSLSLARWLWESPGGCVIGILPLFHVFGMACLHTTIMNRGYTILFPKPPETEELIQVVCAAGADGQTVYPGAEVLFQQLAAFPTIDQYPLADKVSKGLSSAGPLHSYVKDRFEQKIPGVVLREGYGLSESSSGIAIGPYDKEFISGSIGLPLPGVDWKIMDMETGRREMPPGEIGELVIAGPQVMKGYLNDPAETATALREMDGQTWLYTGDLGHMDDYGRVFLSDRKKQLIKVKGYSVFPTEVEELLGKHEAVYEAAVAGLPDSDSGEAVKAWVALQDDWKERITEADLKAWCKDNMTHYKVPKHIEFIESIPKSPVGKVLRRELKEADPLYQSS